MTVDTIDTLVEYGVYMSAVIALQWVLFAVGMATA